MWIIRIFTKLLFQYIVCHLAIKRWKYRIQIYPAYIIVIGNEKNVIFVYENLEIYISLDYTSRIRYDITISIGFLWGEMMPDDSFDDVVATKYQLENGLSRQWKSNWCWIVFPSYPRFASSSTRSNSSTSSSSGHSLDAYHLIRRDVLRHKEWL